MNSRIGFGTVRHTRTAPLRHAFSYPVFMPFLDLGELDVLFRRRWFWSLERRNIASFHRADYLGDPDLPLSEVVWEKVEAEMGPQRRGPVMLLANLRYWGYCFNPISMYFCMDAQDRPVAMLAEVTNTPWGESSTYVVPMDGPGSDGHQSEKILHVSPFMGMAQRYRWHIRLTDTELFLRIESTEQDRKLFDACIRLELRPCNSASMAAALLRHPFMTARVIAAIYWQALRLRIKGLAYVPHPKDQSDHQQQEVQP